MFDQEMVSLLPGPALAAALGAVDLSSCSDVELLDVARAAQRLAGWAESRQLDAVAAFGDRRAPESLPFRFPGPGGEQAVSSGGSGTPAVLEFATEEISAELGMSSWQAARTLADALDLRHRLPLVRQALVSGRVDAWRARVVATGTRKLPPAACAEVEAALLPRLDRVTVRRLAKLVDAALSTHAEDVTAADVASAEAQRDVRFGDSDAVGNKECWANLAAGDAIRLAARIEFVVDLLHTEATLTNTVLTTPKPQLRARALGLLADPGVVTALYQRVNALRARGTSPNPDTDPDLVPVPEPGEADLPATVLYLHMRRDELLEHSPAAVTLEGNNRLGGPTPVPYDAVEEVLGHSHLTIKPVIDLEHMAPGAGYAFTGDNREGVLIKNLTCVFPFCDKPARTCHTDHNKPAPTGTTSLDNAGCLCPRHHRVKTHGRWRLKQPHNGIHLWTSPTSQLYIVDNRTTIRLSNAA
ncbi:MAG: DUF222 domain-containing protein [Nocardioidaceae bacterium]|nr:DUF222 domain-containing protein [Nocardioidaceae bacterium]